ncbi:MAG: hypothetical protein JKY61_09340 [Planctomycetes bacterium]|nr:hypothetical protein [Planctomycetota bacterium]
MSQSPGMEELSLDQAPPLAIPMSFFASAPIFLILAGLALVWRGGELFISPWVPATLGLAHMGTLGFLGLVMLGALYQMIPVVAVARVPAIRLAHGVHALMVLGLLLLTYWSMFSMQPGWAAAAFGCIVLAVTIFAVTAGLALLRSRTPGPTVAGMRLALLCLVIVMVLGFLMSRGWSAGPFPGDRSLFIQVHFSIAILGWVGGLISAVGWQVLPMFYMTPEFPKRQAWTVFGCVAFSVAAVLCTLLLEPDQASNLAAFAALPAACAIWLWHPFLVTSAIRKRRRKRSDPSLRFWRIAMYLAPITAFSGAAALWVSHPTWGARFDLLFGWFAILGWAGLVMHGMLTRIGPFLVWFHRFSPYVGRIPVPAMRRLIPDRLMAAGFWLHLATLTLGALAILFANDWLARGTGALLVATGIVIATYFKTLLGQHPDLSKLP